MCSGLLTHSLPMRTRKRAEWQSQKWSANFSPLRSFSLTRREQKEATARHRFVVTITTIIMTSITRGGWWWWLAAVSPILPLAIPSTAVLFLIRHHFDSDYNSVDPSHRKRQIKSQTHFPPALLLAFWISNWKEEERPVALPIKRCMCAFWANAPYILTPDCEWESTFLAAFMERLMSKWP